MNARIVVCAIIFAQFCQTGIAEEIKVVAWNLESGEAKPSFIGGQLAGFQGVDIWGLSEVQASDAVGYAASCAVGESGTFKHILGNTGQSDRLVIVYNASKLTLIESQELMSLKVDTGRAPLLAKFQTKGSGETFIFMVNHFHRGNAAKRMIQSKGVKAWATTQTVPTIVTGDLNFDVNVGTKKGNPASTVMLDGTTFKWIEPSPFRGTHKGGSVLDFVLVSGAAKGWQVKEAEVVALSDDAVDTLHGSDHRPVLARFETLSISPSAATAATASAVAAPSEAEAIAKTRNDKRNQLLAKLASLEHELVQMKRLIKELGDE
jgi:endonuclease/exonuclease/phosphatase family metal-dependent hydrolase